MHCIEEAGRWLPDLFAWLCDALEPNVSNLVSHGLDCASFDDEQIVLSLLREQRGGAAPAEVLAYLRREHSYSPAIPSSTDLLESVRRHLVVARCIDELCGAIRPTWCPTGEGPLTAIRNHVARTRGRFDRDMPGLVLAKPPLRLDAARADIDPLPRRAAASGDRMDRLFRWLLRVRPGDAHEVDYASLPSRYWPTLTGTTTTAVGVAPWAEGPEDLTFATGERHASPRLISTVPKERELVHCEQAEALVRRLFESGVSVAVLPELVVSPQAVAAISDALARLAPDDRNLHVVVCGTGLQPSETDSELPRNQCVVLNGSGQQLWRQDKLNHYAMDARRLVEYQILPGATRAHVEDIRTGTRVVVRDGSLGRMVVLICEDLAQPRPRDAVLGGLLPEWVFCPVLDGELGVGRWGHEYARHCARVAGASTVVATSLVLPLRRDPTATHVAVGLLVDGAEQRHRLLRVEVAAQRPLFAFSEWLPADRKHAGRREWQAAWVTEVSPVE